MILVDLNVVLDVLQRREPHFHASARVMEKSVRGEIRAYLPAHAFTTIHYLVQRYQNRSKADEAIDWLLKYFEVAKVGREELIRARGIKLTDFEDSVVTAAALDADCRCVITRNIKDFKEAPIDALTPEEFLLTL
ncbi:type II toxin-antitoxin system VapC family toxin [Methylohalobius crimeensis]|uniref:type II toxin-antitoxin system VapC family toxin n=1 Tax=Methylohalobius crimeensis TaxID=244365 RepID=UPI0003B58BB0|nr:PIN domain-containing protein [Methylohalobius crimeensis]